MGILLRMFRLLLCLFFLSLTLINSSTKQGKTYLIETGGKGKAWRKSKGDSKFHSRHTRGKDRRNALADFPQAKWHDYSSISGEETGCKTTKGVNCSFPFKFRGYNYTVCTNDWMNKTKHWCAIETDTNRSLVTWGYCEDSCKKESTGRYYEVKSVADFPHPTQPSEREGHDSGSISGEGKGCELEEDTAYYGAIIVNGFRHIKASLSECVKSCKLIEKCKFFIYHHQSGRCFITALAIGYTRIGYTSGPRDCDLSSIPERLENNLPRT